MPNFEAFSGFDTADTMDEQSFERFKEQMKTNAAGMAALQKQEQKQKAKEDKLIKILLKFFKNNKKMHLIVLISRALEQNIPPFFILSVVLLGNEDIQAELGIKFDLEDKEEIPSSKYQISNKFQIPNSNDQNENGDNQSLINFDPKKDILPLKLKIAIDLWGRNIFESAVINPKKVLERVYEDSILKPILVQLTATILEDYMIENAVQGEYHAYKDFADFMIKGILKKLEAQAKDQKELD